MATTVLRVRVLLSMVSAVLSSSLSPSAWAQTPQFLAKPETEAIARGKVWEMIRYSDGHKIRLDLRANGWGYAYNPRPNGTDTGKWYVNDQGYLCATWRNNAGVETCAMIQRATDKYIIFMTDSPQTASFEFTIP